MHKHDVADTQGVLIHWSKPYDVLLGRFIRRTDSPILALAEVDEGETVLDVATGPGYLARAAAQVVGPSGRAVGIDASPEMIAQADKRATKESPSAEFTIAGAQSLPFDDGSFDAVVTRLAMHHFPGDIKTRAVAEMARVLKPGGRLVVADMPTHSVVQLLHDLVGHDRSRANEQANPLTELVRGAGLAVVSTVGMLRYVKASKPGA